ncbi:MAG: hypothetical protein NXI16_08955 [Alphaproteobacteria bacterium]|nr:hypothetical protein [Alphaproteobacteria bacterium]
MNIEMNDPNNPTLEEMRLYLRGLEDYVTDAKGYRKDEIRAAIAEIRRLRGSELRRVA